MSTQQIANDLVDWCGEGQYMKVIETYYSDAIVSIEPAAAEGMPREQRGIGAIKGKNQWWLQNHEVHACTIEGPMIGDGQFAVKFDIDVTFKPTGKRSQVQEMALYRVEGGKIVREEFFYHMPSANA